MSDFFKGLWTPPAPTADKLTRPQVMNSRPRVVTSLPTSAQEGDEIYYNTGVNGVTWHLRYSANETGNYTQFPWRCIGGSPMTNFRGGEDSCGAGGFVTLNGPKLTVPLRGIYNVHCHGINYMTVAAGNGCLTSLRIGGAGLTSISGSSSVNYHTVISFEQAFDILFTGETFWSLFGTVFNVGAILEVYYQSAPGGTAVWRDRHMAMIPSRVGPAL